MKFITWISTLLGTDRPSPSSKLVPRFWYLPRVVRLEERTLPSGVSFSFTLNDPGHTFDAYPLLMNNLRAAGQILSGLIGGKGTLTVSVKSDPSIPSTEGSTAHVLPVGSNGNLTVVENATIAKAQTGTSPFGSDPDILIDVNPNFLSTVFFDPSGAARSAPIPSNKIDFISAALHELMLSLGEQGYRNLAGPNYGTFTSGLETNYDALTAFGSGGVLYFYGSKADSVYGGPVPLVSVGPNNALTSHNFYELGNPTGLPGHDLISDLMNGVVFQYGTRYNVSALDLAILADLGWNTSASSTPSPVPAPTSPPPPASPPPPVAATPATSFVLYKGGALYQHQGTNPSTGWTYLAGGVSQVQAGRDAAGNPTAFVLFANGSLSEHVGTAANTGWSAITYNVANFSASQVAADTVFLVLQGGALLEHQGTNGSAGWTYVAGGVSQVQAGRDTAGNPTAFVLYSNGNLYEHAGTAPNTGWFGITYNIANFSASQVAADTVFLVVQGGALWEHQGINGGATWMYLGGGVSQVQAGRDAAGNVAAFVLFSNGSLSEHVGTAPNTGWYVIANQLASFKASQGAANTVFLVLSNGTLEEHQGTDPNAGWFNLATNVLAVAAL